MTGGTFCVDMQRMFASRRHARSVPAVSYSDFQYRRRSHWSGLIDLTERAIADENAQRIAAIVESSDDAILAKDLNGTIITWNSGAERLFGYTAAEAIGKPVAMLIPLDRPNEEPEILGRIRRGEHIVHYETIRQRKDGSLVEISLSASPIRNRQDQVIGA